LPAIKNKCSLKTNKLKPVNLPKGAFSLITVKVNPLSDAHISDKILFSLQETPPITHILLLNTQTACFSLAGNSADAVDVDHFSKLFEYHISFLQLSALPPINQTLS